MFDKPLAASVSYRLEGLESRRLLSAEPWGLFPRLIDQDVAAISYPTITGAGQTVAVLDTGINYNHPAMGGGFGSGRKVLDGYNAVDDNGNFFDTSGHGTAVAALVAGNPWVFQGAKYQGIAPGANLVGVRIDDGSGNITDTAYQRGLQWVIDHRAQYNIVAVNISEGGSDVFSSHTTTNSPYSDELAALKAAGVFIAVSSGNDGTSLGQGVEYPAADPSVYSVGSINSSNQVSGFTTRGAILDLLAPGENVPTAGINNSGQFIYFADSGTSFASPIVAGAAALLRQANSSLTPDQIAQIFKDTGQDVFDSATGLTFPRLGVADAITAAYQHKGAYRPAIGGNATDSDMAFAATGRLSLAWYDSINQSLNYASRSTSGVWSSVTVVDDRANVGRFASIAIDSQGHAGIAYYDASGGDLKYAHFTGSAWTVATVNSTGTVGQRPSLAFDSSDRPGITYYDATKQDLRFANFDGRSWHHRAIDATGNSGRYSSLAWDPSRRAFSVAYLRSSGGLFRYGKQTTSGWSFATVDDTPSGGAHVSLAFDKSKRPAFSYYDAAASDLKFAHYNGSSWRISTVASSGTTGHYDQLFFDGTGKANIVFYRPTDNAVYLADGDVGSWNTIKLIASGGANLTAALSRTDDLVYGFLQSGSDSLHIVDVP